MKKVDGMEPAEEIVNAWLGMKGYFTINPARVLICRPSLSSATIAYESTQASRGVWE